MYSRTFIIFILGIIGGVIFARIGRKYLPQYVNNDCHTSIHGRSDRPHSLRSELQSRRTVFIGVMTARKYLDTRAAAVYKTWASDTRGQLKFFISDSKANGGKLDTGQLPIVTLKGVQDNEYPPQKKIMAMLRYMHDHYIDKFHWFMRADDDVYVRLKELRDFLARLDSSRDVVVGQGGLGKSDEINKLGLIENECYCMGGPGVIISRNVLRKIVPNIEHCLKDTSSTHEDVELGRCIRKFAGVSCLWAKQAQELFVQFYNQVNPDSSPLETRQLSNAITIHPVKQAQYMFRLHVHFLTLKLPILQHTIFKNNAILRTKKNEFEHPVRNSDFYHRANISSKLEWGYFTSRMLYNFIGQNVGKIRHEKIIGINAALKQIMADLNPNDDRRKKSELIQMTKLHYGYCRVHPTQGIQFVLAISTKTPGVKIGQRWWPVAHVFHRKQVQQVFSTIQGNTLPNVEQKTVHFIVPLAGRIEGFQNFLKSVRRAFVDPGEKIIVLVVYFPEVSSPEEHLTVYTKHMIQFPEIFLWVNMTGKFNREKALRRGVEYFGNQSLLFFSDVDLDFQREFIYRCRSNTVQGEQAYSPIMFSQFNHNFSYFGTIKPRSNFIYSKTAGMWRTYSYGPVCIYANDVIAVGGLSTSITGWGLEDVTFATQVLDGGLKLFRTTDPGIVHLYHVHARCSETTTEIQKKMCKSSSLSTFASAFGLVKYITAKKYIEV